jgi:hypothetical protein
MKVKLSNTIGRNTVELKPVQAWAHGRIVRRAGCGVRTIEILLVAD